PAHPATARARLPPRCRAHRSLRAGGAARRRGRGAREHRAPRADPTTGSPAAARHRGARSGHGDAAGGGVPGAAALTGPRAPLAATIACTLTTPTACTFT